VRDEEFVQAVNIDAELADVDVEHVRASGGGLIFFGEPLDL
jgi:hypothetical protein